ncbi:MAG: hypothetical protein IJW29_09515, partial [Clostridia bacterium]|nr:hypothetical protein [Clostridia bacterium]
DLSANVSPSPFASTSKRDIMQSAKHKTMCSATRILQGVQIKKGLTLQGFLRMAKKPLLFPML